MEMSCPERLAQVLVSQFSSVCCLVTSFFFFFLIKGLNHISYGFGTNSVAKVHHFAEETKELRSRVQFAENSPDGC